MPAYRDSNDHYGLRAMNLGVNGPPTGGLTARASPNQPSLGPPAGPKPPERSFGTGDQNPTVEFPALGGVNRSNTAAQTGKTSSSTTPQSGTQEPQIISDTPADAIGAYVQEQFTRMKNDRTQTDDLLLRCLYSRKGEYTPEELGLISGDSTTPASSLALLHTYFPITGTKCRAGEAWIADIFTGTEGRLWTISPTPVPNVPEYIKELVIQQIKKEVSQFGPPTEEGSLRERVKELRDIAMAHVQDAAKQATDRMSQKIDDQLHECGFDGVMTDFVSDVLTFPYAVIKGPIVKNQQMLMWKNEEPVVKTTASLCTERVSPFDYYWSQFATSPQEGNIVELMHMTRAALHNCIGLENFNDDKIREVLQAYPTGHKVYTQVTTQRQQLERNTYNNINDNEIIDTFDFWGSLPGYLLQDWGVKKGVKDRDASYEVNAWVINGICIRCIMNPDPLKKRPYYVTAYEKVPGSMIGRSPPMLMRANQEIINSAYRALRRNMGLSSGPFCEVDISRLSGQQAPNEIRPSMVKAVEPDLTGSSNPAYRFHDINSHAQELENTIIEEIKKCDDITGIPAYSYGNAAVSGAGRTVGGLAMLMGNASKGIKKVIGNIEDDVLNPLVTSFYNYNMLYSDDKTLKVDAQVVARGPTGVILKEAQVQRRVEALQVLGPFIPTGIIPKDGLAHLLRQVLTGLDLDTDKIIPDPDKAAQLAALAQSMGQGQGPPGVPGSSAGPDSGNPPAGNPPSGVPPPPGIPPGVHPMMPGGVPGMPSGDPVESGLPPGVHPMLPGGLPPAGAQAGLSASRQGPPGPMQGTMPQVRPDARSGQAGAVAAMLNRGRM